MYTTIRKNSWTRIQNALRSAVMIREVYINDMGDRNESVSADRVIEVGRSDLGFDRVYECDESTTFVIHTNWFFVAYKSIDGAKRTLTDFAFRKYFGDAS